MEGVKRWDNDRDPVSPLSAKTVQKSGMEPSEYPRAVDRNSSAMQMLALQLTPFPISLKFAEKRQG